MSANTHLLLGDGVIGRATADALAARDLPWVMASRKQAAEGHPHQRRVDALDPNSLLRATEDVSHLYVTIGLPYSTAVWARDWPIVIENVIGAARQNGCRIVMFDNIYAYGPAPLQVPMLETHPQQPPSTKGRVRKAVDDRLLKASREEGVQVVIGRSADFYGPLVRGSSIYNGAMERQLAGKAAQWMGNPDLRHSFTFTLDAGRALVDLALDEGAYGEVWHLPTAEPALTIRAFLELSGRLAGAPQSVSVLPKWQVRLLGLFVPVLREIQEMVYQNESDYVFSSAKFNARYPSFRTTPYEEGLALTIAAERKAAG